MNENLPTVVIHLTADGSTYYYATKGVRLITIDENAPDDRVYQHACMADDAQIAALIAGDRVGHAQDGYLTVGQLQAIHAQLWKAYGNELGLVDGDR